MSLVASKTDKILGQQVHELLVQMGVETPTVQELRALKDVNKIRKIEKHFTKIMEILGLDLTDDSLQDSPSRVAKMFVNEIFWGLDPNNFPKCTAIENKMGYDAMVLERNINVVSQCEHHFVTIHGKAHIAYIPNQKVLGLSKMNRIVEYFARRPQVQERLTEQVYYALSHILDTPDVAVMIDANHYCVISRGVEDGGSSTVTSKMGGGFRENASLRAEFFSAVTK